MSKIFTPRNIAIGAGVGAAVFFLPRTMSKVAPNNLNSIPGVKNIGDRYSAGGGSTTHLPGAATKRGDSSSNTSPQLKSNGPDSAAFNASKADQKLSEPNALGKAWHQTQYGNEKGK